MEGFIPNDSSQKHLSQPYPKLVPVSNISTLTKYSLSCSSPSFLETVTNMLCIFFLQAFLLRKNNLRDKNLSKIQQFSPKPMTGLIWKFQAKPTVDMAFFYISQLTTSLVWRDFLVAVGIFLKLIKGPPPCAATAAPWDREQRHHHLPGAASSPPSHRPAMSGKWIHVDQPHLEIRDNNISLPHRPITWDLH